MALRTLLVLKATAAAVSSQRRKNVLFVISDDLRPELPCYGCDHVLAPRTTALAKESITFTRAYAQQALCAPSRNSFLSGRRPAHTKSWQFVDDFREVGPDWTTLPGLFLKNGRALWPLHSQTRPDRTRPGRPRQHLRLPRRHTGYITYGTGKLFHEGLPPNGDGTKSWTNSSGMLSPLPAAPVQQGDHGCRYPHPPPLSSCFVA